MGRQAAINHELNLVCILCIAYYSPCVTRTAGNMIRLASLIPASVVKPLSTESRCRNVNKLSAVLTAPPTKIDPSMTIEVAQLRDGPN